MLIFTISFLGLCKLKPEMVCIINNYLLIIIFSYFILYYKIDEECADPRDWYYFNNVECQRIFTCSSLLFPSKEECMETCNIIIFSLFTGGILSSHSAIRWKDEKSAQKALFLGGNPCCCYGKITLDDNSFKNRTIGKFALSSMRGVPVKDSYLVQVHIFFSYINFFLSRFL